MNKINYNNYGYVMAALLLCTFGAAFLSIMKCDGTGVSVFKLLNSSNWVFLQENMHFLLEKYFVSALIVMILPIIEIAVILIAGRYYKLFFGCASVILNFIVGAILLHNILETIDQLRDLHLPTQLCPAPVIINVFMYLLAAMASGVMIWWFFRNERIANIFRPSEGVIIEDLRRRRPPRAPQGFHGALICRNGEFRGGGLAMLLNETISFGNADSDAVRVIGGERDVTYCTVSYDEARGEYRVRPAETRSVFLASGQPLGKDRIYCIPRGRMIIIKNQGNRFELA